MGSALATYRCQRPISSPSAFLFFPFLHFLFLFPPHVYAFLTLSSLFAFLLAFPRPLVCSPPLLLHHPFAEIGLVNGAPPPFDSALELMPWASDVWAWARSASLHALPPQYPQPIFGQVCTPSLALSPPFSSFDLLTSFSLLSSPFDLSISRSLGFILVSSVWRPRGSEAIAHDVYRHDDLPSLPSPSC